MADNRPGKTPESDTRPGETGMDNQTSRGQHRDWREERRHQKEEDPLRGLFWVLVLILVGVLFFLNIQYGTGWDILWKYILIGLGIIFIIDGITHSFSPRYRNEGWGRFIPGIILLFVGLAFIFNFSQWWPIILIALGVAILLSFLFRRR